MLLTIGKAAKKWGVSRQTLYNKMKEGEISFSVDSNGTKQIDTSELVRVIGEPDRQKRSKEVATKEPNESIVERLLRQQLEDAKRQLERSESRIDKLEEAMKEKDVAMIKLMDEVQENMKLFLEHRPQAQEATIEPVREVKPEPPKPVEPIREPEQPRKKRGLIGRLIQAALD